MTVGIQLSPLAEIPATTLYRILWLRVSVFVVEQQAAYPELDGRDIEPGAMIAWAEENGEVLGTLRLLRYRPLFSGPAVERTPELQFQRPAAEVELAHDDAERRQIASGDSVSIRSNGTSVALRARVSRSLAAGTIRIADEHAADLHRDVEVVKK